jgi:perosamine synthetase
MMRIPVAGPSITQREIDYVTDAVTNAWYGNANVYHQRFEKAFADYIGVRHAIALPSCTSAIHLALSALGIGRGDEVIVPEITWIASAAPITYTGATPVFADIDEKTWCLDPASFERAITSRTKAVIPVDLYGHPAALDAITTVADRHGIAVIEDAAEAIGAEFHGRRTGSFGRAGVFSFHGSKTLTTGEGGMLVTNDAQLHQRALVLRDHGRAPGDTMFFNREVAYKYKMSSMQAALGLAQLERIDELVARKREIFNWYRDSLASRSEFTLNVEAAGTTSTYWMVTVIVDPRLAIPKEAIIERLKVSGIDTRPFFHPLSSIPAYEGTPSAAGARDRNQIAYRIAPHGVNLPSGLNLTRDDVARVSEMLIAAVDELRNSSAMALSRSQ